MRKEVHGLDWKALLLLATAGLYFFATPGGLVVWVWWVWGGCSSKRCSQRGVVRRVS